MSTPTMREEQWAAIPGYEGRYEVSDHGRIKSLWFRNRVTAIRRDLILAQSISNKGYPVVVLGAGDTKKRVFVHRAVLMAFRGPPPEGMECAHGNGVRADCRLENLSWKTHKENQRDQVAHGTIAHGERCGLSKLTAKQASSIFRLSAEGVSYSRLAARYGVSKRAVSNIVKQNTWVRSLAALNAQPTKESP